MKFALKIVLLLSGCLMFENTYSQLTITVQPTSTVDSILQNVFFGPGVGSVSNAAVTGVPGSFATFSGTSSLGISNGIILSNDNANLIPNPASNQLEGPSFFNQFGDPQLQAIVNPNSVMNAAVLQFDFSPATDTLKFSYVFASEEYPEWVCSAFNDVFGFFITGANPAGGNYTNYNVALIPGTALPVSINSVNPGVPGANSGGGTCSAPNQSLAYSSLYIDNNTSTTIIFDGLTTVLHVAIPVVVCDNYHIKLAVGNVSDEILNSAVFLQSNTFGGSPARIHSQSGPGVIAMLDTTILNIGVSTQLTAAKSTSYYWSNGDTTQTTTVSQQGQVNFIVINPSNGCFAMSSPRIILIDSSIFVSINDLNNTDFFEISPNPLTDQFQLQCTRFIQLKQ